MLFAAFEPTPAGSPLAPASTKSLVKIAFPNWLSNENPFATNWFSSDGACTISALGPPVPFWADWIAAPVAEPTYLNVNCGNCWVNCGWMTFGIRPESLTSLVPTIVRVDDVSALASDGATSSAAAARTTTRGTEREV